MGKSLRSGALTNDATHTGGDPTAPLIGDAVDVAMAEVALNAGMVTSDERDRGPVAGMPYEPELAYSQTLVREIESGGGERFVLHAKGAPETIASFCDMSPGTIAEMEAANEDMGRDGLRVIATASRMVGRAEVDQLAAADTLPTGAPRVHRTAGHDGSPREGRAGRDRPVSSCRDPCHDDHR